MKKVYLKYNNMYITDIYIDEKYPENEFIKKLKLNCGSVESEYIDTYNFDKIPYLINKLIAIGLDKDLLTIEEIKENKESGEVNE